MNHTLRPVAPAHSCANCKHLEWGPEEGFDRCGKTGDGVAWGTKQERICDDHEWAPGDPRNKWRKPLTAEERLERVKALLAEWQAVEWPQALPSWDLAVCREALRKALEG